MTSIVGKIESYKPENERFSKYVERLKLYFEANSVPDGKKKAVFLTVIGVKSYSLLSDHYAPAAPSDKSLDDLISTLKNHYEPKPIVIAERFVFYKRDQQPGEGIQDFAAELRRLAANCEFGNHLDDALRDRFVCGLNVESVQKDLLTKKTLTMAEAVQHALSMSSAERTSKAMAAGKQPMQAITVDVNRCSGSIQSSSQEYGTVSRGCYRCGRTGHTKDKCRFKTATCHSCGKVGHISPVCKSRERKQGLTQESTRHTTRPQQSYNRYLSNNPEGEHSPSQSPSPSPLFALHTTTSSTHPIVFDVTVDGTTIPMELDTGAARSVISEDTKLSLFPDKAVHQSDVVLRTYTSEVIPMVGEMMVNVHYGTQHQSLKLAVVKGSGPSLIGRDWMAHITFDWARIKCARSQTNDLEALVERYAPVFKEELGNMSRFEAKLELEPQAKPVFYRPRSVPYALKDSIEFRDWKIQTSSLRPTSVNGQLQLLQFPRVMAKSVYVVTTKSLSIPK